jgi:large subunit ribosomal protein L19
MLNRGVIVSMIPPRVQCRKDIEAGSPLAKSGFALYDAYECLRLKEENNMDALKLIAQDSMKHDLPSVKVGDTVKVHVRIKEGERERIQLFEGTVIAKKHGGVEETFTVRRVAHGVGIERVFPIHSPTVAKVETVRMGRVRRGKLYYLRDRVGKAAKVKEALH